jgi:hypothetical protein
MASPNSHHDLFNAKWPTKCVITKFKIEEDDDVM